MTHNPYNSQTEGTPYSAYTNPEQHEMHQYATPQGTEQSAYGSSAQPAQSPYGATSGRAALSSQDFLARVSAVRGQLNTLSFELRDIASLYQQAMAGADNTQLDGQIQASLARISTLTASIREAIFALRRDVQHTPTTDNSREMKRKQFLTLGTQLENELQKHRVEQRAYEERMREQIARQYRIIYPNATEADIQNVVDNTEAGQQLFQNALLQSRSGQAQTVLGNVQSRHQDIMKIEKDMLELSAMVADVDALIVQQEEPVQQTQQQTEAAITHLEEGNKQVDKGIDHARRRRKLKWICALIVVLIILGVALGVGLGVGLSTNAARNTTGGNA